MESALGYGDRRLNSVTPMRYTTRIYATAPVAEMTSEDEATLRGISGRNVRSESQARRHRRGRHRDHCLAEEGNENLRATVPLNGAS